MGAQTVGADEVAKEQWNDPGVRRLANQRWGGDFFNCDKDALHAKIAAKIFADAAEYEFATKLIYQATFREIKRILRNGGGWVVLEIPLLFESGHYKWLDYTVYASAPLDRRIERNRRRGWDAEEIARRERWFMSREEKIARSGFVLENDGTLREWEEKGRELGRFFMAKSAERSARREK